MPVLLENSDIDLEAEAVDDVMTADEEATELASFLTVGAVGDLSHGGQVGRAEVFPTQNHQRVSTPRATARRAWTWNGTETTMPLAWNPEGTQHDGGRHYLRKRHCLCCGVSGFVGTCRDCIRSHCSGCNGGTDKKKIIPLNYLSKEKVPFPQKFYGAIDCFLPTCVRRGGRGFKSEEDMRMHARGLHRMEYASYMETSVARQGNETDALRKRVDELTSILMQGPALKPQPMPSIETVLKTDIPRAKRTEAQKRAAQNLGAGSKARAAVRAAAVGAT